ncbi:kinase-like protein [Thelephora ganbajun]|uniref:Kinase-like protein n=1 Tax=Thelephora ganbajun TaxID=370292 RepID=A0ACB6ZFY4_THEGA|nr:kinase-like protein [Thelephora ganbajun]
MYTPPLISIVSARMENGNIMDFIKAHQKYNRLRLLADAVTGLKFLHENDIVHGDLKGANILIDSECCARLADFGLAVVVDESTSGEMRGTTRWMAPELMHPEAFGFTGKFLKSVPSKGTDIYAIGMTILEVLTGCRPFNDVTKTVTVICKVMNGDRPVRPPSGFSDILWELTAATWAEQQVQQPQMRPSVSTVLDRLVKDVNRWEKSIIPLVPKQWQENATNSDRTNCRAEVIGK